MGVSLDSYRAAIGLFNCHLSYSIVSYSFVPCILNICLYVGTLLIIFFLICPDVELNPGPDRTVSLKIGHLNVRSLNSSTNGSSKFDEIASIILNENLKIFAISETWLSALVSNDLFNIPGYCPLIRLDRLYGRRGGGVAMYVSSEFVPSRRYDLESSDYEILWVEIKIKSTL